MQIAVRVECLPLMITGGKPDHDVRKVRVEVIRTVRDFIDLFWKELSSTTSSHVPEIVH